jgi:integrase
MNSGRVNPLLHQLSACTCSGDGCGSVRLVIAKPELHQLRHYYASVMLAGGGSIKKLAEYLGHSDPAVTLRVYAHMLPCSYDRARAVITERFNRMTGSDF